jgi:hypothetical protein
MPRRRRRIPGVLVLLMLAAIAAAVPVAPAAAKGMTGLSVCGADGCVDRSARPAALASLLDYGMSVADPGRAPFVRLKEHIGDGGQTFGTTTVIYLPGAGLQRRDDGSWALPYPEAAALLKSLTRGVRPLPASQLKPHKTSGPPIPEAPRWTPGAATVVRHAGATGGSGDDPSGLLIAAGAALAVALGTLAVVRRRRSGAALRRPAIG